MFQIYLLCVSTILHGLFESKFDLREFSTLLIGSFSIELTFMRAWALSIESLFELLRVKEKVSYKNGRNVLEFDNVLLQIQFDTSKRKLDI